MNLRHLLAGCFQRPRAPIDDSPAACPEGNYEASAKSTAPPGFHPCVEAKHKAQSADASSVSGPTSIEACSVDDFNGSANCVLHHHPSGPLTCATTSYPCKSPVDSTRSLPKFKATEVCVSSNDYDAFYTNPLAAEEDPPTAGGINPTPSRPSSSSSDSDSDSVGDVGDVVVPFDDVDNDDDSDSDVDVDCPLTVSSRGHNALITNVVDCPPAITAQDNALFGASSPPSLAGAGSAALDAALDLDLELEVEVEIEIEQQRTSALGFNAGSRMDDAVARVGHLDDGDAGGSGSSSGSSSGSGGSECAPASVAMCSLTPPSSVTSSSGGADDPGPASHGCTPGHSSAPLGKLGAGTDGRNAAVLPVPASAPAAEAAAPAAEVVSVPGAEATDGVRCGTGCGRDGDSVPTLLQQLGRQPGPGQEHPPAGRAQVQAQAPVPPPPSPSASARLLWRLSAHPSLGPWAFARSDSSRSPRPRQRCASALAAAASLGVGGSRRRRQGSSGLTVRPRRAVSACVRGNGGEELLGAEVVASALEAAAAAAEQSGVEDRSRTDEETMEAAKAEEQEVQAGAADVEAEVEEDEEEDEEDGEGEEEDEEEWLEAVAPGSFSMSISDSVSYIFLPVLVREGSQRSGAEGTDGGVVEGADGSGVQGSPRSSSVLGGPSPRGSPSGLGPDVEGEGGERDTAGTEAGMEAVMSPAPAAPSSSLPLPAAVAAPAAEEADVGSPRTPTRGGRDATAAAAAVAAVPTAGRAGVCSCGCAACSTFGCGLSSPAAAVCNPGSDSFSPGAEGGAAGADCSISGLCMTRAVIRRLGLLAHSPGSPTPSVLSPAASVGAAAGAASPNHGTPTPTRLSGGVGGTDTAAVPAARAQLAMGAAAAAALEAGDPSSPPPSPFAAARGPAEAALLAGSRPLLPLPPVSQPFLAGPAGSESAMQPHVISPAYSSRPSDGARALGGAGSVGNGGSVAAAVAAASRKSELLLLLARVCDGGGGGGGGGAAAAASYEAAEHDPAAWRPLRDKYRAVRMSPSAAAAVAAAAPTALSRLAWEVEDEAGVAALAAGLAAEVASGSGGGGGAVAAAASGVVVVQAARVGPATAAEAVRRKGGKMLSEAEVEALFHEALTACSRGHGRGKGHGPGQGQDQGQGQAHGGTGGGCGGLYERSELWLPLRDSVAWRRRPVGPRKSR